MSNWTLLIQREERGCRSGSQVRNWGNLTSPKSTCAAQPGLRKVRKDGWRVKVQRASFSFLNLFPGHLLYPSLHSRLDAPLSVRHAVQIQCMLRHCCPSWLPWVQLLAFCPKSKQNFFSSVYLSACVEVGGGEKKTLQESWENRAFHRWVKPQMKESTKER